MDNGWVKEGLLFKELLSFRVVIIFYKHWTCTKVFHSGNKLMDPLKRTNILVQATIHAITEQQTLKHSDILLAETKGLSLGQYNINNSTDLLRRHKIHKMVIHANHSPSCHRGHWNTMNVTNSHEVGTQRRTQLMSVAIYHPERNNIWSMQDIQTIWYMDTWASSCEQRKISSHRNSCTVFSIVVGLIISTLYCEQGWVVKTFLHQWRSYELKKDAEYYSNICFLVSF